MKQHRLSPARITSLCRWLGVVALSACSSADEPSSGPPSGVGGSTAFPNQPSNTAGSSGAPVGSAGAGTGQGSGGTEGNVTPVGLAGTGNTPAAGGSGSSVNPAGAGGTAPVSTAGAGGAAAGAGGTQNVAGTGGTQNVPQDCDVPPPASLLEGWASVAGLGVNTTTGGGNAPMTIVTTLAALQAAAAGTNAAVIGVRGQLDPGELRIGSNKTIIGLCGAEVHGHIEINASVNVIVRNLEIVGFGPGDCSLDPGFDAAVGCSSGDDAVTVQRNAHHIWFDHCAVRDGTDGNLDVSNAANFVTISWTKFFYTPRTDDVGSDSTGAAGHRFSNLVGGTDSPSTFDDANALNVTWHHNWWADNVVERQPRIRFGQNHLYNNYWNSATTNYCVRAGIQAQVLLEGNYFDGVDDPHEFNNAADQLTANITAGATNTYEATTSDMAVGGGGPAFTDPPYDYQLDSSAGVPAAVTNETSGAGPH